MDELLSSPCQEGPQRAVGVLRDADLVSVRPDLQANQGYPDIESFVKLNGREMGAESSSSSDHFKQSPSDGSS